MGAGPGWGDGIRTASITGHGPATPESSQGAPGPVSAESADPGTMNIDERIKALKERFDAWDGHTKTLGSGSARQDQASRFNIDRRPSEPSAIVQKLLKRKSVFDEDSRRLERTNEPVETEGGGRPAVPSGGQWCPMALSGA